jgi:hypothetical protein
MEVQPQLNDTIGQVRKIALQFAGRKGDRGAFSRHAPQGGLQLGGCHVPNEGRNRGSHYAERKKTFVWPKDGTNDMTLDEAELDKTAAFSSHYAEKEKDLCVAQGWDKRHDFGRS